MTVADGSNASRMGRQQQYLSGLLDQFWQTVKGNQSKLNEVLQLLKGHMVTDARDNTLLHDVNAYDATKVYYTIEGGAVTFSDDNLVQVLNDYKNFGIRGQEEVAFVGGNAKMSEFQAAMGICNLRHVDEEIRKRGQVDARYRDRLSGIPGIRLCPRQPSVKTNYAYFPVVFDGYKETRDQIFEKLKAKGVVARRYYYPLTNAFECYKNLETAGTEKTPVAQYVADRVLSLPMYADLAIDDVDRICDLILK